MVDKLIGSNKEAVLKHFGKTEEDLESTVAYIKQWVEKQPHLPDVPERIIRIFLIRKKFSLERTKQAIDTLYKLKLLVPEIFSNWDIMSPPLQQAINTCALVPLPKLTPEFDCVSVMNLFDPDINEFNVWEVGKVMIMLGFLRMQTEYCLREHLVLDYKGFTISHMTKITPTFFKKFYTVLMKGFNLRPAAFHFINPPPLFDQFLAMIKLVMKPKLYDRIMVHSDLFSLHKYVPKEILPKEYGGNEISTVEIRDLWKQEMEKHRDFFLEDEKYMQSDESKRFGNLDEDIFGSMHGSFRKLQID